MQVQIQQPGVSGVDQSLPVTKHTQSLSNADCAREVLREVAIDHIYCKASGWWDSIVAHICEEKKQWSDVD